MTHSYKLHFFHLIWSTKNRQRWITEDISSRLYPYLAGIIKNQGNELIEIGGMADHLHILLKLDIDKFSHQIRDLKANSSKWIHQKYPNLKDFAWQEGYGSFSVSYSSIPQVRQYIIDQEKHHSLMTFEEEYLKFLKGCRVNYDARFVLGCVSPLPRLSLVFHLIPHIPLRAFRLFAACGAKKFFNRCRDA